jgi:hypothetical protein
MSAARFPAPGCLAESFTDCDRPIASGPAFRSASIVEKLYLDTAARACLAAFLGGTRNARALRLRDRRRRRDAISLALSTADMTETVAP